MNDTSVATGGNTESTPVATLNPESTASFTDTATRPTDNLALIIGCSVGGAVALIIIIALVAYCVLKIKKKRAFEGKYSPSANEQKGGVQMNDILTIMQPPPPERLI